MVNSQIIVLANKYCAIVHTHQLMTK